MRDDIIECVGNMTAEDREDIKDLFDLTDAESQTIIAEALEDEEIAEAVLIH
ncbi:MAG: hypothetical protein KAI66_26505 [Lentisphaeria bacterium]|nr:hypothetical protein [Lentisphaeria bacterium]